MLALWRNVGESVTLTGGIVVRVGETRPGKVKLLITAPAACKIDRTERLGEFPVDPADLHRHADDGCPHVGD